jgi:hypothetical protein
MEKLADMRVRAEAGDVAAQYRLAAALAAAGDPAGADHWLEQAAAGRHPGALYTKATILLARPPAEADPQGAARLLATAVEGGGFAAARLLAVLKALGLGVPEDFSGAVGLVLDAARAGRPDALRELAALAHVAGAPLEQVSPVLGMAAARGDAIARLLPDGPAAAGASLDDLAAFARHPAVGKSVPGTLRERGPRILHYRRALSELETAYVIVAARPLMTSSAVVDTAASAARHAEYRTSDGALIDLLSLDLALIAIWRKLARLSGLDASHSELLGVLRYRPGQEYRPHYDFLPEDADDYSEVRRAGQRCRTLLVALNDGFEGGETVFPKIGVSFRGAAGDALFFENVDESGPIRDSLHAGAPVRCGEKWMLTLWFREKRFWYWSR